MNQRMWKHQRVIITGAGGFIGSHLTRLLVDLGAQVVAMVHYNARNSWGQLELYYRKMPRNLQVVPGDIRDNALMRNLLTKGDIVFHLAALIAIPYSYRAPQSFVETNILGTLNVLEACRAKNVRLLIHTSTSEVYGTAQYVPMNERHPLQSQSPYSATKIAADKLVESYYHSYHIPVILLRPFNSFGPGQSSRAIIPTILSSLLDHDRSLSLGSTKPIRDFTYVEDTVRAFVLAAERSPIGKVINIGSGRGRSIQEVIRLSAKVLGVVAPRIVEDRHRVRPPESEVWKLVSDSRQAKRLLGWNPKTSFQQGLFETAQYIRVHPDLYKTKLYNI